MASVKLEEGASLSINKRNFVLVSQKGQGGNGFVWSAESEGQSFAIKVVERKNSKRQLERSKAEAEFCHRHDHVNVVKVIDYEITDGRMMMVMPLYEGSLRKVMESNDFSVTDRLNFAIQLAEGVGYIHSKDAVHRDLKPENLLVKEKHLVICDFGIAHFEDSNVTRKNDLVANRNYAAPEQRVKGAADRVGKPADVYAVGCIINELFTGQNPVGSSFAKIFDFYPFLYEIDELVESCTRQDPNERPSIELVEAKLKLIRGEYLSTLSFLKNNLKENLEKQRLEAKDSVSELVLESICEDALTADYLFRYAEKDKLLELNSKYHSHVRYFFDDYLISEFYRILLLELCMSVFEKEVDLYEVGSCVRSLDLSDDDEHINMFESFKNKVKKYSISDARVLNYFVSCNAESCRNIIAKLPDIEKKVKWASDPLYIVELIQTLRKLLGDHTQEFKDPLFRHLIIHLPSSDLSVISVQESNLICRNVEAYSGTERYFLGMFIQLYGVMWSKKNDEYTVIFQDEVKFEEFKKHALALASSGKKDTEPFKYMVQIQREAENLIQLMPWRKMHIPLLAQILFCGGNAGNGITQ